MVRDGLADKVTVEQRPELAGEAEAGVQSVGLRPRKSQSGWRTEQKGMNPRQGPFKGTGINSDDDDSGDHRRAVSRGVTGSDVRVNKPGLEVPFLTSGT